MRLSEAIMLGSTVVTAKAGGQHFSETQAGCALGMAAIANGWRFRRVFGRVPEKDQRTWSAETVWGKWLLSPVARPCDCWRLRVPHEMRTKDVIAHLFDYHVMEKKDWTLERLAAWVATQEPGDVPRVNTNLAALERVMGRSFDPKAQDAARQDAEEWQRVRTAFEARYASLPSARLRVKARSRRREIALH